MAEPLYEDKELRIDYLPDSPDDHILYVKENGEEMNFIIPFGILREMAKTPRGDLERKLANFNEEILYCLKKQGIGIDGLHVAVCQAYAEEEERFFRESKVEV